MEDLKRKNVIVINVLKMLCTEMYEVVFSNCSPLESDRVEPSVLSCINMRENSCSVQLYYIRGYTGRCLHVRQIMQMSEAGLVTQGISGI